MKSNFNEIDLWIMKEYGNIEKLLNSRKALIDKFDEWMENQIRRLIKKHFDDYEIRETFEDEGGKCIYFNDRKWVFDKDSKWGFMGLSIVYWSYEALIGEKAIYIGAYTERSKKFGIDKKEYNKMFIKNLRTKIEKNASKYTADIWGDGIYRSIDFYEPDEFAEFIKNGKEKEIINKLDETVQELTVIGEVQDITLKSFQKSKKRLNL